LVDFGTVAVGSSSVAADIIITNTGETATTGPVSVIFTGPFSGTGCSAALAPGASCTEKITFTPTAAGAATGTMNASAGTTAAVSVTLQGSGTKGALTFAPSTANLANVAIGATKAGQVVLSNSGTGAANGLAVAVTGTDFAIDLTTTTCKTSLESGATCVVGYVLAPKTAGDKMGQVTATATGSSAVAIVTATTPTPATPVISPTTAPLTANVGADSAAFTFTVANSGGTATGNLVAAISGTDKDSFRTTTSTCTSLEPRAVCTIAVVFNSATAGKKTAKLTVTDSTSATAAVSADLVGTATNPATLAITGGPDLGSVEIGKTGATVTFTITNKGDTKSGALAVSTGSSEFVVAVDQCTGKDLNAAETCTVGIALKPVSAGSKAALLTVTGTTIANLTLTGTATPVAAALLTVAPATWDFGVVPTNKSSAAKTFTVTNEGLATTGTLTVATTGAAAASFITTSTCNAPLAVNATCTVTVTFQPALAKALEATLAVGDGAISASAALSGTGVAPAMISLDKNMVPSNGCFQDTILTETNIVISSVQPRYLDWSCNNLAYEGVTGFTGVVVGDPSATASTVTFTLTADNTAGFSETGAITPAISGDAAADFTIGVNTCVTSMLPSQTCTIQVKFAPTTTGVRSATLTVTSAQGGTAAARLFAYGRPLVELYPMGNSTHSITLPTATVPVTGLNFGDQAFGNGGEIFTFRAIAWGSTAASKLNPVTIGLTSNGGGASDDFRIITNTCSSLAASQSPYLCDFTVQFYPQSSKGAKAGIVSATGTNGGAATKAITGNATGPLSWEPVDAQHTGFGDVTVGSSSTAALTLTLKNGGGAALGPVNLTIDSSEIAVKADNCSSKTLTVPPGATSYCTVELLLVPTSTGTKTGKITASAGAETAEYALVGNGVVAPPITVTPNSASAPVAFAATANTAKSDWMVFTVTNPATVATREIQYSIAGGQFELATGADQGTCGATATTRLSASGSCTIKARFIPTDLTPGLRTGTLTVFTVDQSIPVIALSGLATNQIVVSPTSNAFSAVAIGQTSAAVTFTVTNLGAAAATLATPSTVFANGGFALANGTCNASSTTTIAAGASCTLLASLTGAFTTSTPGVGADPTVAANQYPAQIAGRVTLTAGQSTQRISLTGSVTTVANVLPFQFSGTGASATSVLLGTAQSQGSTATPSVTVMYQNKGKWPASTISAQWCTGNSYSAATCSATDAEFSVVSESSTCLTVSQLAPNETCTMTVRLLPQAATVTPKYLNLKYNNGSDTANVVAFRFLGAGRTSTTPYISPANYTFPGTTASGSATPPTTTLTFNNPSSGSVTPTAVAVVGQFAITGGTCALNTPVPPAGSCTLIMAFTPTDSGTDGAAGTVGRAGSITMTASAVDYTIGLAGTMKRPAYLTMTYPSPVMQRTIAGPSTFVFNDFGTVVVGRTSPTLTFTVTNVGDVDSLALTADVQGTAASSFQASGCAGALAAHASCTATVSVTPAAAGWVGAVDTVLHVTDAQGTPLEVYSLALNAMGNNKAQLARSPAVENFAAQAVKSASCYTAVTLTNGASTLYATTEPLTVAVSSSDYEVIVGTPSNTDTCTYTPVNQPCAAFVKDNVNNTTNTGLPGGSSCDAWVRFVPQTLPSPATINGTLTASGGTDAGTVTVSMTGTAKSALSAARTAGSAAATQTITITNALGAPTTGILSTSLTGATNIRISANTCVGKTLTGVAGGNTCAVTLETIAAGAAAGTLTVSGTPGNSATVNLAQ
jgi:hypothetical protein